ncbi:Short integuments 2, mitochondrial [Allomyces arbusculus]|nr:Short integuments 2, mitochondrial [Allomyces arbusculus]
MSSLPKPATTATSMAATAIESLSASLATQLDLTDLGIGTPDALANLHNHAQADGDDFAGLFSPSVDDDGTLNAGPTTEDRVRAESRKYLEPSDDDIAAITELLEHRMKLGRGECVLELGSLDEDGTPLGWTAADLQRALVTLQTVADTLNADATLLGEKTLDHVTPQTLDAVLPNNAGDALTTTKTTAHKDTDRQGFVLVRRRPTKVEDMLEVRVAVCGNVDAGKSTLLGVMTRNALDNGRGKARVNLFRHKHEQETGRTSSLGMECMGFDAKGNQVGVEYNPATDATYLLDEGTIKAVPASANATATTERKASWDEIAQGASKMITFIDLAGHERYLKTTVYGLCGAAPDFALLCVGANMGVIGMTKEHLGLSLALNVPVMVVVTKVDMCPPQVLEQTLKQLLKILKSPGCRKIPMFVRTSEDVVRVAASFVSERICPIFLVSNVDATGLPYLRQFLNVLPMMGKYDITSPTEYSVVETFSVPGVGTVVSGTLTSGIVHVGDSLLLGPDSLGHFMPTQVKGIHMKRVPVPVALAGHSCSLALKKVKRSQLRKGMVLVSKDVQPFACREFEAEVLVLNTTSTTIHQKYQAMLHCGNVRQTVSLVDLESDVLRTGDRARVRFKFLTRPEYIKPGVRVLFREGRTKGIGKITRVYRPGEVIPWYNQTGNSAKGAVGDAGHGLVEKGQAGGAATTVPAVAEPLPTAARGGGVTAPASAQVAAAVSKVIPIPKSTTVKGAAVKTESVVATAPIPAARTADSATSRRRAKK